MTINGAGTATGVTAVTVNYGGTVLLDDSGTDTGNRLGAATTLALNGGTFNVTGNAAATAEQIGAITIGSGYSTVRLANGAGGLALNATSITSSITTAGQDPFVNFIGAITGTAAGDQLVFSAAQALVNGILNYGTITNGSNFDFASVPLTSPYDLVVPTTYVTSLALATSSSIVKLTGNDNSIPAAGVSASAVIVQGNVTVTGLGLEHARAGRGRERRFFNLPLSVPVNGSVPDMLVTNSGATATFNGVISNALTGPALDLAGAGTTILNNANTYNGGTTLESGTLSLGNAAALGNTTTGTLTLVTGTIQSTMPVTVNNPVSLSGSLVTLGGSNPLTFGGTVTVTGSNTVYPFDTAGTAISTALAGSGTLTAAGNTFAKSFKITGATAGTFTLTIGGLTTGNITWTSSTTGGWMGSNIQNAVNALTGSPYNIEVTGENPFILNFTNVPANTSVAVSANVSLLTGGTITFYQSASAVTPGILALSGDNHLSPTTLNLTGGNLLVTNNNSLPPLTTLSGGTLLASTPIARLELGL